MAESEPDFIFQKKPDRSQDPAADGEEDAHALAPLSLDPRDWYYDMTGDKIMLIFNHYQYKRTRFFGFKKPKERTGTARDVRALTDTFSRLGFRVAIHNDQDHDQILQILSELCARADSRTACVCVCVLSHGESGGELFAADKRYELSDLLNLLQFSAPGLVGKPKLLIVQACRGGLLDPGQRVQLDGPAHARLPSHVDTLVLASSVEEHVSWRDREGSWLVQALCRVLRATHRRLDLLQMTALVTSLVARERESNTPGAPDTHGMKQTPETRSTLTKLLRFTPHASAELEG